MDIEEKIQYVIEHTEVIRPPQQKLATFGTTVLYYYLLTEPIYAEMIKREETVIREGKVTAERPRIVTPFYLLNLFEGFEHGREYAQYILKKYGPNEPGLLFKYKNEPLSLNIVSTPLPSLAQELKEKLDREKEPLAVVIKGIDEMWDISLLKFIHELTRSSLGSTLLELESRGLLEVDKRGIPRDARERIEELFEKVKRGECQPYELKLELDRWGIFEEYEDRFLALFRRR